jgi:hypothetical protein
MELIGKLRFLVIVGLIITYGVVVEVKAQARSTRIVRFEVDGKEVKQKYRVFVLSSGRWIAAGITKDGFRLPTVVQKQEHVTLVITFGKHRLNFEDVHISNFRVDWTVGVDTEPFAEENMDPNEKRAIQKLYYIVFEGEPGRRLTVTKWKRF